MCMRLMGTPTLKDINRKHVMTTACIPARGKLRGIAPSSDLIQNVKSHKFV